MSSLEAAKKIIHKLRDHGHVALLAGGCVRDRLLGGTPQDHDVATDAPPQRVCEIFRRTKKVGVQFGVILVRLGGCDVEVATFRTDGDYLDGRRPERVQFTNAEADARRRDFTINGMFYDPFEDRVVDYVGGQQDLAARLVRCIGEPRDRFAEDHLRMLRAVRFAARLGFDIEAGTFAAIRELAPRIHAISAERIRMELEMILADPARARGWRLMAESGLVPHLVASARWEEAQATRTEAVLAALPKDVDEAVGFAAMLSSFEPSAAARICRELKCSNDVIQSVGFLLGWSPRIIGPQPPELADLKMLIASLMFPQLATLARAVCRADQIDASSLEASVQRAAGIPLDRAAPPPLVTGDDLLAMGIPPGPEYSRVLEAIYRGQQNEEIHNRSEALATARRMLRKSE